MIAISAIPLTLLGVKMIGINSPVYKATIKNEVHLRIASSLASDIDEFMKNLNLNMDFAVAVDMFSEMSWEERTAFLLSVVKAHDEFIIISMLNTSGREISKVINSKFSSESSVKINRSESRAFIEAKRIRNPVLGEVFYRHGRPRINIVYPLDRKKEYIYVSVALDSLWHRINAVKVGEKGFAYLVDSSGGLICHRDTSRAIENYDLSGIGIVEEFLSGSLKGTLEYKDYNPEGKSRKVVGAFARVSSLGWGIIVQQDEKEAYGVLSVMRNNAIAWIFISVILSAIAASLLARNMTRPIIKLTRTARKYAKGDLDHRVDIKSHDELLTLGNTFNAMAEQIKTSQEELVSRERLAALGQMASVVGHEIRNPLGVINNAIYFIKTKLGPTDPKVEKHIGIIEREVAASNKIVTDLLGYSRNRVVKPRRSDINAVIKESVDVIKIPGNVKVQADFKEELFAMVDPDEMREVFVNILDNACQSMPGGGIIKVRVSKSVITKSDLEKDKLGSKKISKLKDGDRVVMVLVQDNGIGIDNKDFDNIFVPFFTTKQKGTGLGLAVTQRIVERNKGLISIHSIKDSGTTVMVKLPAV